MKTLIIGGTLGLLIVLVISSLGCAHRAPAVGTMECDGNYTVRKWDTFPEFGKIKPVESVEMVLKQDNGQIVIFYEDGSHYYIEVNVSVADDGLHFSYTFPGGIATVCQETVPLRKAEEFLEIFYGEGWVRFAKMTAPGEREPYPRWEEQAANPWRTP